ncbi:GNAT family N-acetyltransferase [Agreia sp. VKM Ac-1783]|jgi:GNAT superfamily N-acetyltransferase|uniref:GNAT family N-acetyltransferase n=1 Tax=Agreia sp. VKM Ac-1783 TaxID=1938889 RepID=UPI000A2ACE09|nr:GNAT family N-acetyltransferase [Agreia sp. VKM Ac-1783]SMQ59417.1 Ribosomal protein S18 acetylase RimI [Agreia sp. VKM Ac-1783]
MPEMIELQIHHVAWSDPRAIALRDVMDAEMQVRYGLSSPADAELSEAIHRALAVDESTVVDTVLLVDDGVPVAHAGLRMLQTDSGAEWEVKRVIVDGTRRGRGLGRALMNEIIDIARQGGARRLILQAGDRQPEAVGLYSSLGFTPIPVYAPYAEHMPQSLCFELILH